MALRLLDMLTEIVGDKFFKLSCLSLEKSEETFLIVCFSSES